MLDRRHAYRIPTTGIGPLVRFRCGTVETAARLRDESATGLLVLLEGAWSPSIDDQVEVFVDGHRVNARVVRLHPERKGTLVGLVRLADKDFIEEETRSASLRSLFIARRQGRRRNYAYLLAAVILGAMAFGLASWWNLLPWRKHSRPHAVAPAAATPPNGSAPAAPAKPAATPKATHPVTREAPRPVAPILPRRSNAVAFDAILPRLPRYVRARYEQLAERTTADALSKLRLTEAEREQAHQILKRLADQLTALYQKQGLADEEAFERNARPILTDALRQINDLTVGRK